MNQVVEKGIADRLRRSEPSAFESLVAAFHQPVYRFLIFRVGDTDQAEEMTAETFYQLVRSFPRFRGDDGNVRAFVYSTARYVHSSHFRNLHRASGHCDETDDVIDMEATPLQRVLADERAQQLAEAIADLSHVVREVLLLRYSEDLSIDEIIRLSIACRDGEKSSASR